MMLLFSKKNIILNRLITLIALIAFIGTSILPVSLTHAQTLANLPAPGTMIMPTPQFIPAVVKGIKIFPNNPLRFDFIIDTGNTDFGQDMFEQESAKLIKYFLASLTVPEDELWVNLSPSGWVKC